MVILEFKIDESNLSQDLTQDIAKASTAALSETYFQMPVRLKINKVEMFERDEGLDQKNWLVNRKGQTFRDILSVNKKNPWLRLPILDVATVGLETIRSLIKTKRAIYYLPPGWNLNFEWHGKKVTVSSQINGKKISVNSSELLEAFKSFSKQVREFLKNRVHEIKRHPYWGEWLIRTSKN